MHQLAATNHSPEVTSPDTGTLAEGLISAEVASETEQPGVLRLRVASLETELTNQSEMIKVYGVLIDLALSVYLLFLLLGPVLDALTYRHLPELRSYQRMLIIEPPCLWLLSRLLLRPSKAGTRS